MDGEGRKGNGDPNSKSVSDTLLRNQRLAPIAASYDLFLFLVFLFSFLIVRNPALLAASFLRGEGPGAGLRRYDQFSGAFGGV